LSAAPGGLRQNLRVRDTVVLKAYRGFEPTSTDPRALRAPVQSRGIPAKRKGTPFGVPFLLVEISGIEPLTS